jgi:hypothetical protein
MPAMNVTRTEKACKGCGQCLPAEEFPWKSRKAGIRWAHCETCLPAERARKRKLNDTSNMRLERRRRDGSPVDREPAVMLSGARIALWLGREARKAEHANRVLGDTPARTVGWDRLAHRFGTTERQISRLVKGQMVQRPVSNQQIRMPLDTLDKWLCHAGEPWTLRELFPELFRFDDADEPNDGVVVFLPKRGEWARAA